MSHPSREEWLDYLAGDADDEEALEAHLFACSACAEVAATVAALTTALREMVPGLLTASALARLRARGVRIREQPLAPGGPYEVVFPGDVEVLLFRLGGLDLAGARDVEFTLRVESTGELLHRQPEAPFDRDRGEVLLACQQHFAQAPPDTVAEVRVRDADGHDSIARYTIHHHFAARS